MISYGVLDILPISIAGVVCTLAVIFWAGLIFCRHIRECIDFHRNKKSSTKPSSSLVEHKEVHILGDAVVDLGNEIGEAASKADRNFDINTKMHMFVRYFFPVLSQGKKDKKGKVTTVMLGYKVPSMYIEQLLLFSFVVLALSLQVAISNYLFIKSYGCSTEPYIHCFEAKTHFLVIGNEELDCTDSTATENITSIICYDLTLNAKLAFSEAGTVVASGAFYFVFITWMLLALSNMDCWKKRNSNNEIVERRGKFAFVLSVQFGFMLISLCIVHARVVALVLDQDTVFEDFVYVFIKTYVVVIGGVVPWWSFKWVGEEN